MCCREAGEEGEEGRICGVVCCREAGEVVIVWVLREERRKC